MMGHDTGFDILHLNISSGSNNSLFSIPFNRTDPPFTSISSVSLNPRDDTFYGVMVVGSQPYLVRFDEENLEFTAKLPFSSGGYSGGSFAFGGKYFYTALTSPPERFSFGGVEGLKGYLNHLDPEIKDWTNKMPMALNNSMNATPNGMSGLVTVRTNLEGEGDEEDYIIGIDEDQRLVITKDNCTHQETWFVQTNSLASGGFGAAYTFNGKIYFDAKDGSGIYEVPLQSFQVSQPSIQLKLAGTSQKAGGTDFAGWTDEGFNCMKSPSPFYAGDCQLGYHEVAPGADATCPAGSVEI